MKVNQYLLPVLMLLLVSCSGQPGIDDKNAQYHQSKKGSYLRALNARSGETVWEIKTEETTTGAATANDTVYFAGGSKRMFAVNKKNGQVIWKEGISRRVRLLPRIDGENLYYMTGDGILHCRFKSNGARQWEFETGNSAMNFSIGKKYVYLPFNAHYLVAIDKLTGRKIWTFDCKKALLSQAFETGGKVIFSADNQHVYCLDNKTGQLIWKWNEGKTSPVSMVKYNNTIYFGSIAKQVIGLNLDDGSVEWEYKTKEAVLSTPLIKDGVIYYGSNDKKIYAQLLETKEILWSYAIDYWIISKIKMHEGNIYFCGTGGGVYCINAEKKQLVWKHQVDGPLDTTNPLVIDNDMLYIGNSNGFMVTMADGENVDLREMYSK